ncbi:hypothetical protein CDEF62S_01508 [Castellaniella defragrans]
MVAGVLLTGAGLAGFSGVAAAAPDAITFNADSGSGVDVSLGGAVTISGTPNNVETTTTANGVQIKLAQNVDLGSAGSLTIGNSVLNNGGLVVGGASGTTVNSTGLNVGGASGATVNNTGLIIGSGPSVTTGGINAGSQKITGVANGTSATDAVNKSQLDAVGGAAYQPWKIQANGDTATPVASGGTVQFKNGQNIAITRSGTAVTISTVNTPTFQGANMGGQKITNVANGNIASGSTEAVNGGQIYDLKEALNTQGVGVKYFHANSALDDSQAIGTDSTAMGPNAIAGFDATSEAAIALGRNANAQGKQTLAIGDGATVESQYVTGAQAIGQGAKVTGITSTDAIALGTEAQASAVNATALGARANAAAAGAVALGQSTATGAGGVAIGASTAGGANAIAMGTGASAAPEDSISLGRGAGVGTPSDAGGNRHSQIAIGQGSGQNVNGNATIAIGAGAGSNDTFDSSVTSTGNVAVGTEAGSNLNGEYNVSMGFQANQGAGRVDHAVAIGGSTQAAQDAAAIGYGAKAASSAVAVGTSASADSDGVAIGRGAQAGARDIALGLNSAAVDSDANGSGYLTGSPALAGGVVSVGSTSANVQRRIVNVADGASGFDAVNVRQLKGAQANVATLIGGGVTLNADGTYSPITLKDSGGASHSFSTVAEAIGAVSSGTINVLPPDAVKYNADGGISNVSAGQAGTDAVNVQQMNQAIANNSVKYFSIDPNSDPGNKANNGASGANSMAIGPVASAQGESALALGHNATVEADRSTAIGYTVGAYADNATVVGSNSNVYDQGGVAVGQNATSHGTNSIAMGTGALTETKGTSSSVDNAVAIGTNAWSTANSAVAVGQSSRAAGVKSIAQGFEAQATAESSQAFGTGSSASAQNAQASGTGANASGASSQARGTGASASATNAQASGTNASSYATDGIAVGTNARSGIANPLTPEDAAKNVNGIAIGNTAVADDVNAMAVGVNAGAHAQSAAAFGDGSSATGQKSLAVGSGASASQASAAALGDGSTATGEKSLAVGSGANASAASAAALGAGAQALTARSVALGDGAVTAGAVGTSSTVVDKVTYNFAGTNPVGTVSIGTDTDKRTLTNVAAGRVSGTSTDAINGSQLYGTNLAVTQLGNDLDTAGQSVAGALGGDSKYNPATHQVTANLAVNGNTYNNVQDALSYVGQGWNLTANGANGAAVKPGDSVDLSSAADNNIVLTKSSAANSQQVKFGLADNVNVKNNLTVGGNTTVAGNTTVTGTTTLNGGATISKTLTVNPNTTVNFGGNKITNVAAGSADTDAPGFGRCQHHDRHGTGHQGQQRDGQQCPGQYGERQSRDHSGWSHDQPERNRHEQQAHHECGAWRGRDRSA